ncbi:MAG TPA: hypothetical protein PK402_07105 [Tepidisphaeraceae bacterium]|nr:hypothetical protein [Tepidisphaeraceae bacterium]
MNQSEVIMGVVMANIDKKQRHKAKREAQRRVARRQASISPIKRLADANGELECWISEDFEQMGQSQIFVHKRATGMSGGGLNGIACFLVDRGVVGLKDAWTRMNVDRIELREMIDASRRRDISMRRCSVDEVRAMVAAGIRWASENGMRLPKDWAKPASIIGGVGDWAKADVSAFIKEFAGHSEDLRQRLISEPFDTYIKRDDISFVFADTTYLDQKTGEYTNVDDDFDLDELNDFDEEELEALSADLPEKELDELIKAIKPCTTALASDTEKWLVTHGKSPSTELPEAWSSMMLAAMMAKSSMPEAPSDDVDDLRSNLVKILSSRVEETRLCEYERAIIQVFDHLETDPLMMQKTVMRLGIGRQSVEGVEN